ncbi:trehalose-phosphatase [Haloferax namakaokahaiae]|uniref:Trehalose 6-phosphate phosphatase n=1 Tax=Haloferax namakaokahaiae TaxID=1748331 RepID=A0ABD5ZDA8_9EURY
MSEEVPPNALDHFDELARWLAESEGLLLGVDFDGTLAPIVDDPDAASITPTTVFSMRKLAETPNVSLAVVSGRGLDDLSTRVGFDDVVYAGNHGLELSREGQTTVHPEAAQCRSTIRRLCEEIDSRLSDAGIPGYEVENKGVSATVHFRRVPAEAVSEVVSSVEEVVADVDDVRLTTGKQIRELRPAVEGDKGRVMRQLADSAPGGWRTMYIGDDTTDEDAIREIEPDGIGIRVLDGDSREVTTAATYRLDGQEAVPRFLAWVGICLDTGAFADD